MNSREYIAYEGENYTIEWFYDANGNSQPHKYYTQLDQEQRLKLLYLFKRMGDFGRIHDKTKFNFEGDSIFAFKPKPDRFLCFFVKNKKIIVTNGFVKKQQKLPKVEKEKALLAKQSYEDRVRKGAYYE